jgi:hypothetical protein
MLHYASTSRLGEGAIRSLCAEAAAIERDWWRGGLGFETDGARGVLSGSTPLFHRSAGIPDADDLFLAFADAVFILDRLAAWAKSRKVKWAIRMHDEAWGAVDPSGCTVPLLDQMDKWAGRVGALRPGRGQWEVDEARRAELLARHAGRR